MQAHGYHNPHTSSTLKASTLHMQGRACEAEQCKCAQERRLLMLAYLDQVAATAAYGLHDLLIFSRRLHVMYRLGDVLAPLAHRCATMSAMLLPQPACGTCACSSSRY